LKAAPSSTEPAPRPSPPTSACKDGRIVEVGRMGTAARETHRRRGAWVTPGFVDIHTHYDGQATWDETFSPSIHARRDDGGDGQLRRRLRAGACRAAQAA
jgi:cytosine/adenosine deaminase-related metal-dependent hydrolase